MPNDATSNPPMTETIDSASAAASTLFLGHNGDWWDFWLIISLIGVAIAAIAAGVTTTGSIVSHKREAAAAEDALDRYKLNTAKEISEAQARAAEARLELEKFKAPRTINASLKSKLISIAEQHSGQKYALSVASGIEATNLLCEFESIFQLAKWERVPPIANITVDTACGVVGVNTISSVHIRKPPALPKQRS